MDRPSNSQLRRNEKRKSGQPATSSQAKRVKSSPDTPSLAFAEQKEILIKKIHEKEKQLARLRKTLSKCSPEKKDALSNCDALKEGKLATNADAVQRDTSDKLAELKLLTDEWIKTSQQVCLIMCRRKRYCN